MTTLLVMPALPNLVVSSEPRTRMWYAAATSRAAHASTAVRSSKRPSLSIAADGGTGLSHGAVALTIEMILGPMAEFGVQFSNWAKITHR